MNDDLVCNWCHEEQDDLRSTDLGWLCVACIRALRSRGEQVIEEDEPWSRE